MYILKAINNGGEKTREADHPDSETCGFHPVDADDNQYLVERLLERGTFLGGRGQQEIVQYLIKWEGYSNDHNCWVDENDIHKDLVESFLS